MRGARSLSAALLALSLAALTASVALGDGGPVVRVGGFSSQVSTGSAAAGASVGVETPPAGGGRLPAGGPPAGAGEPPPPPPALASDSPRLADPTPAGPGSLWYQGPAGERCIYAPAASPLCFALVAPAAALDLAASAARLAAQLSLALAPIEASPSAARDGLTGAASWFWLATSPAAEELSLSLDGETVTVSASPGPVSWSFGDGSGREGGAGIPFRAGAAPAAAITHVYGTRCLPGDRGADPYLLPGCERGGYPVSAGVSWTIAYRASGPLSASAALPARSSVSELAYPVSEARSFLGPAGA